MAKSPEEGKIRRGEKIERGKHLEERNAAREKAAHEADLHDARVPAKVRHLLAGDERPREQREMDSPYEFGLNLADMSDTSPRAVAEKVWEKLEKGDVQIPSGVTPEAQDTYVFSYQDISPLARDKKESGTILSLEEAVSSGLAHCATPEITAYYKGSSNPRTVGARVELTKELTPKDAADMLVERYPLAEATAHHDGNRAEVKSEVRDQIANLLGIAEEMGISNAELRYAFEGFLVENPEGTDLDQKYGAAFAGLADYIEADIVPPSLGKTLWDKLVSFFNNKKTYLSNVELQRFGQLADIIEVLKVYGFDASQKEAIIQHAIDRSHDDPTDFMKFLREAAPFVKKGGTPELRRFERDLGWMVDAPPDEEDNDDEEVAA